ncbi:nitrogenase iron-molybdenum cofactor biosynthesis protein NifE [Holophaga foetida]|uniref:nitrogenase iron-molybdenum cofactor biosynthesis protein NifE n=1 Tax=Holophaga foetida TaxID=35839 RepID=UPI0002473311|nr:nitrogenase iron-molybdenum cofactor biosynthesis protein NifE [Holophaga foetida]
MTGLKLLDERRRQVFEKGSEPADFEIACGKPSLSGAVSQRACVFCGSRVVLYPIADALHIVHGPVGCAAYTWDIRGSRSSGPELHRMSFTTDLRETDIIYGGEKKLEAALRQLIARHNPRAAFVYGTCVVGVIGDDVDAVCRKMTAECGIPVIAVHSEGFKGTKKDGYKAACDALWRIVDSGETTEKRPYSINILGEFNIAGEAWILKEYFRKMGVEVVSTFTGDGRIDEIRNARQASLNLVQCSGSITALASRMKSEYGIPFIRVSFFGIEDVSKALYAVADTFKDNKDIMARTRALVSEELSVLLPQLEKYRKDLTGKKAAIYVGGAFKAFSLIVALRHLGMSVVLAGSQTGNKDDYETLKEICDEGAVIVDDTNPVELCKFMLEKGVDLLIGGVKERPMAYKLGVAFCDHNHERKIPLAGFEGMVAFAKEVHASVMSPVWKFAPRMEAKP